MQTLILILHIVLCIFLIIVVLLQPGKGGDAGIAFGGGGSQSVFGARGATTFLQKLTTYAAVLFMVTTITLAWYSSESLSRQSVITEDALKNLDSGTTPAPGGSSTDDAAAGPRTGEARDTAPATAAGQQGADQQPGAADSGSQGAGVAAPASPGTSGTQADQ